MGIGVKKVDPSRASDIFVRASLSEDVLKPYDDMFKARGFAVGDIGQVDLTDDSTGRQAKKRFNAVAEKNGYKLNWREKDNVLYFRVQAKSAAETPATREPTPGDAETATEEAAPGDAEGGSPLEPDADRGSAPKK